MINVDKLKEYWKGLIALAGAVGVVVVSLLESMTATGGEITLGNVVTWLVALATALGVVLKANASAPADQE